MEQRSRDFFLGFYEISAQRPLVSRWVFGVFLLTVIGAFDFYHDPYLATSIFYFIPLLYLTEARKWPGIIAACIAASQWALLDFLSTREPSLFHFFWNSVVRLLVFLTVSLLFSALIRQVRGSRANAIEVERLANAKSEFASMVSHELRTPLMAIMENLAIVYDGSAGPLTAEQEDHLGMAKRNLDRLGRLINDILDYQRLENGSMINHLGMCNLNAVVRDVAASFEIVARKKGLRVRTALDPDLPRLSLDKDRMSQVVANLLQNAINYGRKAITISTGFDDASVRISVEDDGAGIPAEEMPKLFHSFQRLSTSVGQPITGTGLGLAICKRIVEGHHGTIEAESRPGVGTSFSVKLKR